MPEMVNRQGTPEVHRLHILGNKKGTAWHPVWISLCMSLLIHEYMQQAEKSFTPQSPFPLYIYMHIHTYIYKQTNIFNFISFFFFFNFITTRVTVISYTYTLSQDYA